MAVIYGLFDPRQSIKMSNVRYIGQTIHDHEDRLTGHINAAIRADPDYPVYRWIRKILVANVRPVVHVLETVTTEPLPNDLKTELCETWLDVCEVAWIAEAKHHKWRIVNATPGGRSGDRISQHPNRADIVQRLSNSLTGRKLSDEHRQHIGDAQRGIPRTDEAKAALSRAMTGNPKAGNGSRAHKAMRDNDPELDRAWRDAISERSIRLGTGYELAAAFQELLATDPVFALEHAQRAKVIGQTYGHANGVRVASILRTCAEVGCGMTTNPGALARHQKASGHTGWT